LKKGETADTALARVGISETTLSAGRRKLHEGPESSVDIYACASKRTSKALRTYLSSLRHGRTAPPCRSYRNLITIGEMEEFFAKIEEANVPGDITAVKTAVKPFKIAMNDLIQTTRAALTALKSAMKAGRKQKEKDEEGGRKASGQGRKVLSSAMVLFEICPEKGKQMPTVRLGGDENFKLPVDSLKVPFIITGFKCDDKAADPYSDLRDAVGKFHEKFKKNALRNTDGRAEQLLKGTNQKLAIKLFNTIFLDTSTLSFAKLHPELQPASFGVVKGQETVSVEKGRGPTVRVQFEGMLIAKLNGSLSFNNFQ
jgi:hypothetical protein